MTDTSRNPYRSLFCCLIAAALAADDIIVCLLDRLSWFLESRYLRHYRIRGHYITWSRRLHRSLLDRLDNQWPGHLNDQQGDESDIPGVFGNDEDAWSIATSFDDEGYHTQGSDTDDDDSDADTDDSVSTSGNDTDDDASDADTALPPIPHPSTQVPPLNAATTSPPAPILNQVSTSESRDEGSSFRVQIASKAKVIKWAVNITIALNALLWILFPLLVLILDYNENSLYPLRTQIMDSIAPQYFIPVEDSTELVKFTADAASEFIASFPPVLPSEQWNSFDTNQKVQPFCSVIDTLIEQWRNTLQAIDRKKRRFADEGVDLGKMRMLCNLTTTHLTEDIPRTLDESFLSSRKSMKALKTQITSDIDALRDGTSSSGDYLLSQVDFRKAEAETFQSILYYLEKDRLPLENYFSMWEVYLGFAVTEDLLGQLVDLSKDLVIEDRYIPLRQYIGQNDLRPLRTQYDLSLEELKLMLEWEDFGPVTKRLQTGHTFTKNFIDAWDKDRKETEESIVRVKRQLKRLKAAEGGEQK